jgi:two-component system cell cycle response regulator DivK
VSGPRILVVEDDANSQKLVCAVLELNGFEVVRASTADAAVTAALEHQPELVLMDIQLPGDSGVSAMERIRQNPTTSHIPVVATTAFAMKGDRERFLSAGFAGYLSKPIDVRSFVASVNGFIGRSD